MSPRPIDVTAVREGRAEVAALVARYPELTSAEARQRLAEHLSATSGLTVGDTLGTLNGMATARHAVNIRLEPALIEALDAAAEAAPVLSRHALCRAALHIGLAAIVEDPALVLKQPVGAPQPIPKKAKKKRAASK